MKQERINTDYQPPFLSDRQAKLEEILNRHPITVFFDLLSLKCSRGKLILELSNRGEFHCRETYGCVVDCVACILGRDTLGACFLSEYETNFHAVPLKGDLVVRAEISSLNAQCASFSCEMTEGKRSNLRLIAEASGTLCVTVSA